jgi:holo-[acyl-carrier protein] synthase
MPPRPPLAFPYPLHVGTDICCVARIARILRSSQGPRFVRRVLTPEELARARPAVHDVLRRARETAERGEVGENGREEKRVALLYQGAAEFMAGR